MNFKERLNIVNKILKDSPYETQKNAIKELFKKTRNNLRKDIILRLIVIDSCYSTNMNKRLFGFEDLADFILEIEPELNKLNKNKNVEKFIKNKFKKLNSLTIGIDKKGEEKKRAFSLITKYIYFRTNLNFPIYDSLVFEELHTEGLIENPKKPSKIYFEKLIQLKNKFKVSFDDLDKYFWVCGKIRKGNLSLLISSAESYKEDFINKLNLSEEELNKKSKDFDNILHDKLISEKIRFENSNLIMIHNLAKEIESNKKMLINEI